VETIANITGQSVVISPVSLLPRFNPNATSTSPVPPNPGTDPRQTTPFCAAWTLGTITRLTIHRSVHSVILFELEGPRGFFRLHTEATQKATPEVEADATATTSIERFPCFHVLHDLASFSKCGAPSVSHPDNVAALHCSGEDGRERLLLANLTPHEQIVRIQHAVRPPVLMHIASTSNDASFIDSNTLTLDPYVYITLDVTK
jgi:D-apionolactonase